MTIQEITPQELDGLPQGSCCLIDVREPIEHAEEHVNGALLIPLGELKASPEQLQEDRPIVVMCRSGKRGEQALATLQDQGFTNTRNLAGGLLAWKDAGLPIVRGAKRRLPLMQQVQIVIGLGVLAGVVLSKVLHPNFLYLSAFFGAGLLFAGLSGWCGLAILMSKMPWNKPTVCKGCG